MSNYTDEPKNPTPSSLEADTLSTEEQVDALGEMRKGRYAEENDSEAYNSALSQDDIDSPEELPE